MDVVVIEVFRRDPGGLLGFGVRGQLAADRLAVKADVDRDADLAIGVGDAVPGSLKTPTSPVSSTARPVSSRHSRMAHAVTVSFFFSAPVGMVHNPEPARRSSRTSPRLLRRTTLAEGFRLVGLGACGSSQ